MRNIWLYIHQMKQEHYCIRYKLIRSTMNLCDICLILSLGICFTLIIFLLQVMNDEISPNYKPIMVTTDTLNAAERLQKLISSSKNNFTKNDYVNPVIETKKLVKKSKKRILFYTPFFNQSPWNMAKPVDNFTEMCGCDFNNCEITYDRSKFETSDLVIFHARDMPPNWKLELINSDRPPAQLWLYFVMENPFNAPDVEFIDKFFNLTASYRLSSDIHFPYRFHERLKRPAPTFPRNYADGKSRQIAWAVSHCGESRDQLARKLHEYGLTIDNFGECTYPFLNPRPIPRSEKVPYHEYKFIFAAENRLCNDYVTEKYWYYPFDENANTVPIVLGGADYSNSQLAIPGSHIEALNFSSPRKLAEYILLLDKNDTLYNEYFKWKARWKFYDEGRSEECHYGPWLCNMCTKLHSNTWSFKVNPLRSIINARNECTSREELFDTWIYKDEEEPGSKKLEGESERDK